MNDLGWFRGPVAKMVVAAGVGLAGGFGTVVAHAAVSPSPSGLAGCRSVDQRFTVHHGADHAEPWRWLGHDELPEYVDGRPFRRGGGGGT